jgi:hypothetical protein
LSYGCSAAGLQDPTLSVATTRYERIQLSLAFDVRKSIHSDALGIGITDHLGDQGIDAPESKQDCPDGRATREDLSRNGLKLWVTWDHDIA